MPSLVSFSFSTPPNKSLFTCAAALFFSAAACSSTGLTSDTSDAAASPSCAEAAAAYCPAGSTNCDADWTAAQLHFRVSVCMAGGSLQTGCAGFDVLTIENVDAPELEYFDSNTGALVAVLQNNGKTDQPQSCLAGPSTFTAPSCAGATLQTMCPFNGVDAGGVDAGSD